MREGDLTLSDLGPRVRFAAELADCLDQLDHAATSSRMVVAQSATVGVEGKLADACDEVPVEHEAPAFALFAEAQILERHKHGDRKGVVDRDVVDVGPVDSCPVSYTHLRAHETGRNL